MYAAGKKITLKHLLINGKKQIGLKFYSDKVIQALIKGIPGIKWSDKYDMAYTQNTSTNLNLIYQTFKGVAWINGQYFFTDRPLHYGQEKISVDFYRKRPASKLRRHVPEDFLQKLEIRKYSLNTAKTYISMFEKFMNYHKHVENLMAIDEEMIHKYLQHLVQKGLSDSSVNQSINAIKFYYEVVKGMPNRFYAVDRPMPKETLPKVLSKEDIGKMIAGIRNIKHRCMVSMLYATGLRRAPEPKSRGFR
ncbi:MAG: phage integrase N-terminal SAM-like domain-containing protein [Bacteroidota bacterium]